MIVNPHGEELEVGMSVYVTLTGQAGHIAALRATPGSTVRVAINFGLVLPQQQFPADVVRPFNALAAAETRVEYARTVFEGAQAFYANAQKELETVRANDTTTTSQESAS